MDLDSDKLSGTGNSYDDVPYTSYPYRKSHPDNLAVLAALFGMQPPELDTCRVLELGCGTGGNLIPMAQVLPDARFRGIDLSNRQIGDALTMVQKLGLTNIHFEHRDILDIDSVDGRFDYILCHGVYSWVPPQVQQKILEICRQNLSPQGVAYISYNTYPGWHMRGMVREMMRFHAGGFEDSASRVAQSRALLDFLITAIPAAGTAYEMLLRDELQVLSSTEDSYLFHEHLEDCNEAVYFHQFAERVATAGLRFLSEAQLSAMVPNRYSTVVKQTLANIASDIIHMEQYLDFVYNRMFRQTLVCHQEVPLNRDIGPDRVTAFYVASPLAPAQLGQEPSSVEETTFQHPNGMTVTVRHPIQKTALLHLGHIWPRAIQFEKLLAYTRMQLRSQAASDPDASSEATSLGELVLECYASDLIELHSRPDAFVSVVTERPQAFPMAGCQAEIGAIVTNCRHESVKLGEFDRHALRLLDGKRDRKALIESLTRLVIEGVLVVDQNDELLTDREAIRDVLTEVLDQVLPKLAQNALLVG